MSNLTKILPDELDQNEYKNLLIVGIDEAGRGPLAGPVVAACVFLDNDIIKSKICSKINDSKKLTKIMRKRIFSYLQQKAHFGIGIVDEKTIDKMNILQATKLAMLRAYQDFCKKNNIFAQLILVDGNFIPFDLQHEDQKIIPIVKGDTKSLAIAAASILAKETRDQIMLELHQKYPYFSWDKNAGYPTKFHVDKIKENGICEFHRKSFEPIKSMLQGIKT